MKTLPRRWPLWILLAGMLGCLIPGTALAQLTTSEEERLQVLSDPEALKKKLEKDKTRTPFEFFRSQVAPFDVLPYLKPYQWSTVFLDVRSNYQDYEGSLQFFPVALPGMPQEVLYAREARLIKEQRSRLGMQMMLPRFPKEKEMNVELLQPGAVRYEELWQVPLRLLPPHQMLVIVLSKEGATQYANWSRLPSLVPAGADRDDALALDLQRYYRLVLPEDPDKAFLSPHPLTWATVSHVIWDGLPPDSLSVTHQQAMLDWLHWGGQLVLIGGAGPTYSIFRESFLGSYLPADPTGENTLLGEAELKPLSEAYPPTVMPALPADQDGANAHPQPVHGAILPHGARRLQTAGAHPAAPESPHLPHGVTSPPRDLDDNARRRKPPPAGRRRAGGSRTHHHAHDQSDRPDAGGLAGSRYVGQAGRAAATGRSRLDRALRQSRHDASAVPSTRRSRSELVSHNQSGCRRCGRCPAGPGRRCRATGSGSGSGSRTGPCLRLNSCDATARKSRVGDGRSRGGRPEPQGSGRVA